MEIDVRMVKLCMHDLPYQRYSDGNTDRPDSYSSLPIYVFWNEVIFLVEH
jgi:hypothetical protein